MDLWTTFFLLNRNLFKLLFVIDRFSGPNFINRKVFSYQILYTRFLLFVNWNNLWNKNICVLLTVAVVPMLTQFLPFITLLSFFVPLRSLSIFFFGSLLFGSLLWRRIARDVATSVFSPRDLFNINVHPPPTGSLTLSNFDYIRMDDELNESSEFMCAQSFWRNTTYSYNKHRLLPTLCKHMK